MFSTSPAYSVSICNSTSVRWSRSVSVFRKGISLTSANHLIVPIIILLIFSIFKNSRAQTPFRHFAGSLHSHSAYSDGNMANNPAYTRVKPCFEYADQSLYVDYWGISDHNHSQAGMSLPNFRKGILEADSVNQPGSFVALYGTEYGIISSGGHVLVYGIDSLIGWEQGNFEIFNAESDYNSLFDKVSKRPGAIAYLAHMSFDDYNYLLSQPYKAMWDSAICGMALKSGPAFSTDTLYNDPPSGTYLSRYRELLAKGYHVAPGIDHDSHYINFGRTNQGRTIILADTLTRASIYEAIRSRRFYATDDYNARLEFTVNNYGMSTTANGSSNPTIRIKVNDPDNEITGTIRLYYGVAGNNIIPVVIATAFNTDSLVYTHFTLANEPNYYFTEIIQADGQRLYSAPVWYTRNASPSPVILLNFTGSIQNRSAKLDWVTSSEQDADRFEILRSSENNPFAGIGSVKATGFTSSPSYYTFDDPEILLGPTSYQLKIFNLNGDFSYSQPILLSPGDIEEELLLFPNPSSGDVWAIIQSDSLQHLELEVMNSSGQLILRTEFFTSSKKMSLQLPAEKLTSGLYLVRITNKDSRENSVSRLIRN